LGFWGAIRNCGQFGIASLLCCVPAVIHGTVKQDPEEHRKEHRDTRKLPLVNRITEKRKKGEHGYLFILIVETRVSLHYCTVEGLGRDSQQWRIS